ncbi:50S ribosomal protein L11 methyltransferase [Pedobacter puniceum]|uniref:Ribosomal protein L11 methyltransferase n=1 Tax=Pedobacter puniceum TaxID=2666136 RepID=A0A7K0FR00_9SPHI|nr:50S ribosomal protein L11 methyltransferase [Pedobacter puniceum]MRX48416.1 50S ribosomal protein L11 methyltransferase [Pedobacter puniceum]
MNYYELVFTLISTEDFHQDLLINELAGIGFDTFEETDLGFKAYIKSADFNKDELDQALSAYYEMFTFKYEINLIPQKNWNEVWESNFSPIELANQVYIRATFHEPKPYFPYEIVIDPKMAFGTGHHQTTVLMLEWLLETELKDKSILDMGCGTGILAILASKLGAKEVDAIDYDELSYDSALENAALNNIQNLTAICGSKEAIPNKIYDVILANINRNILLEQIDRYATALKEGGELFMSGFYKEPDLEIIIDKARKHDLKFISHKELNNWISAKFIK